MRRADLLFVAVLGLCAGCAALVASSGQDLTPLRTRDEVHTQFGKPDKDGVENGVVYEEYFTHRKIAERNSARLGDGYGMALLMTCGLADLVFLPRELFVAGERAIAGETIRVTYDESNDVTGFTLDGQPLDVLGSTPTRDGLSQAASMAQPAATQRP
jgi:hypothetical protein